MIIVLVRVESIVVVDSIDSKKNRELNFNQEFECFMFGPFTTVREPTTIKFLQERVSSILSFGLSY